MLPDAISGRDSVERFKLLHICSMASTSFIDYTPYNLADEGSRSVGMRHIQMIEFGKECPPNTTKR